MGPNSARESTYYDPITIQQYEEKYLPMVISQERILNAVKRLLVIDEELQFIN
jgi:hypothetical protein